MPRAGESVRRCPSFRVHWQVHWQLEGFTVTPSPYGLPESDVPAARPGGDGRTDYQTCCCFARPPGAGLCGPAGRPRRRRTDGLPDLLLLPRSADPCGGPAGRRRIDGLPDPGLLLLSGSSASGILPVTYTLYWYILTYTVLRGSYTMLVYNSG
jgi:hypothetical protein